MFKAVLALPLCVLLATAVLAISALTTGRNADDGSARQVLRRERQYTEGILRGDIKSLASVFAEGFVDTSAAGVLRDKRQMLGILSHATPPTTITETGRRIQIYGDTAVVTVRFDAKGTSDGKSYEFVGRATDVWVKRRGTWYCVAAHSSQVAPR